MKKIILSPLRTPIIQKGDSVANILYEVIQELGITIDDGDVLVIAETPVAVAEGHTLELKSVNPSEKARKLAEKYQMDPHVVEVVLQEADEILGGVQGVLLTIKNHTLIANAGVDLSNAPLGFVTHYPKDPQKSVQLIRTFLEEKFHKKIAVIMGDSRVQPLRRGTIGVAMAVAGMESVEDFRGRKDLYGRELQITFRALADDLVSAAQLLLGESDEGIPAVLIKGVSVQITDNPAQKMEIPRNECLFMNSLSN
ncbi:MAG: coenzyme F420-0:L-glutamate ligase [Candidatus Helarchaeota archaeon]|nr:coenzyme F420-0:L-glutamate ligase [Candidatus Helarchaeota archaeon]